jgi:hypothetical protein
VFGSVERIADVVQFVDLIATWNSHPIMPLPCSNLQLARFICTRSGRARHHGF